MLTVQKLGFKLSPAKLLFSIATWEPRQQQVRAAVAWISLNPFSNEIHILSQTFSFPFSSSSQMSVGRVSCENNGWQKVTAGCLQLTRGNPHFPVRNKLG